VSAHRRQYGTAGRPASRRVRRWWLALFIAAVVLAQGARLGQPAAAQGMERAPAGDSAQVRFAAIGDYGLDGPDEAAVARLVKSWEPDFIVTLGDSNYPSGNASSIDRNIGKYYHAYIGNYVGSYGAGAEQNRFFPTLGNHDYATPRARPYLDYFTLPGNERYYRVTWGPVEIYCLDSEIWEPDGNSADSLQAAWLRESLAESTATWKLVAMHSPPYSSGAHGGGPALAWPFEDWGVDAVLAGHEHYYERIMRGELPYLINGLGGHTTLYPFYEPVEGSTVRFNDEHGAMLVEADEAQIRFRLISVSGRLVDDFSLLAPPVYTAFVPLAASGLQEAE